MLNQITYTYSMPTGGTQSHERHTEELLKSQVPHSVNTNMATELTL